MKAHCTPIRVRGPNFGKNLSKGRVCLSSLDLILYYGSKRTFPSPIQIQEHTISFASRDLDKILTKIDIPSSGSKKIYI